MATVVYKEKQRFRDNISLAFLAVLTLVSAYGTIKYLLHPEGGYGNAIFLLFMTLFLAAVIWRLTHLKLKIKISDKGIKFRTYPNPVKKETILWEDIEACELVETPPAAQWSGGNITFNHEKRISLCGRNGLAVEKKDGTHYFIGCRNTEELRKALQKLGLNKQIT